MGAAVEGWAGEERVGAKGALEAEGRVVMGWEVERGREAVG